MAGEDIQNLLRTGIEAARDGNKEVARALLEQVVTLDTRNETAWMWLATVLDSEEERQRALRRVLSINPDNERAQQALRKLQTGTLHPVEDVDIQRAAPPAPASPQPMTYPEMRPRRRMDTRRQLALVVAMLMIVAAVILALGEFLSEDEEEPTQIAGGGTATPSPTITLTPSITFTPRPTRTIDPNTIIVTDLPGQWTPAPDAPTVPPVEPTPWPDTRASLEIVFSGADEASAPAELLTVRADGDASPDTVTVNFGSDDEENAFTEIELLDPAYSPDGQMLAFTAQTAPDVQEIFVLVLASGALRQLTDLGASITDGAAWSPDGERLAFSSNAPSTAGTTIFDIYEADVDSGDLTTLTGSSARSREPAWSPDGRLLAFSSDQGTPGEREIWAIDFNTATRTPQKLTDANNSSFAPDFSPDGRQIVFVSNRSGDNDLYVMNADGANEHLISVDDGGIDERDPAWSPDGNWILLSTNRSGGTTLQLWLVRPDGSEWMPVTDGDGDARAGYWLPINQDTS